LFASVLTDFSVEILFSACNLFRRFVRDGNLAHTSREWERLKDSARILWRNWPRSQLAAGTFLDCFVLTSGTPPRIRLVLLTEMQTSAKIHVSAGGGGGGNLLQYLYKKIFRHITVTQKLKSAVFSQKTEAGPRENRTDCLPQVSAPGPFERASKLPDHHGGRADP
jgi:hypothetical protein